MQAGAWDELRGAVLQGGEGGKQVSGQGAVLGNSQMDLGPGHACAEASGAGRPIFSQHTLTCLFIWLDSASPPKTFLRFLSLDSQAGAYAAAV